MVIDLLDMFDYYRSSRCDTTVMYDCLLCDSSRCQESCAACGSHRLCSAAGWLVCKLYMCVCVHWCA